MSSRKISAKRPAQAFSLGQKAFEKISAVEGVRLTAGMRRDLKALDQKRVGTEAARQFLIKKYGRSA